MWLWLWSLITQVYGVVYDHGAAILGVLILAAIVWALATNRPMPTGFCACGHTTGAHEHYRAGSECSATGCGCPRLHAQKS